MANQRNKKKPPSTSKPRSTSRSRKQPAEPDHAIVSVTAKAELDIYEDPSPAGEHKQDAAEPARTSRPKRAASKGLARIIEEEAEVDTQPVKKARGQDLDSEFRPVLEGSKAMEDEAGSLFQLKMDSESDSLISDLELPHFKEKKARRSTIDKILFKVPDGVEKGLIGRIKVDPNATFSELLNEIHEQLGCLSVKTKPDLRYRFDIRGSDTMKLTMPKHWEELKEELMSRQKKRKDGTVIGVQIVVADEYLTNLRHTLSKGKKSQMTSKGDRSRVRKKEFAVDLNANTDDEADSEDMDHSLSRKEQDFMEALKSQYSNCGLKACCGKPCKINKNAEHEALTWQQLRSWATALAGGMAGVTLKLPPKNEHFSHFHADMDSGRKAVPREAQTMIANVPGHVALGAQTQYPFVFQPYFQPGFPPQGYAPLAPTLPTTPPKHAGTKHSNLSSPTTPDNFDYPSITAFFEAELCWWPESLNRKLDEIQSKLEAHCVFSIKELDGIPINVLTTTFGLTWGDAHFLEQAIQKGIRKVQKEHKNSKRARMDDKDM